MKALVTIALALLALPAGALASEPYGWTISASATDPYANTTVATGSVGQFYLWFVCANVPAYPDGAPRVDGFSAAEFAVIPTGIQILATTYACIVINPPPFPDLLVACPGCSTGPMVMVTFLVLNLPGSMSFAPSVTNGVMGTVDCETQPTLWGMDWIGIDTTGSGAPSSGAVLCEEPVAVEGSSWGRIKETYR